MTPAPNPVRRNEQARRAILHATVDLIATQNYAKVTIEAIAAAAGVGKQTIYRWWPNKGALALDAINEWAGQGIDFPDTGDIIADLIHQMDQVIALLNSEIGVIFRGVIAEAQSDPRTRQAILDTIIEPRTAACQTRLASAIAAGQLRADISTRAMVELIYAPIYYRLLLSTDELSPGLPAQLLAQLMSGLAPAKAPRR
jgi:AcrR family transcriptional regulator